MFNMVTSEDDDLRFLQVICDVSAIEKNEKMYVNLTCHHKGLWAASGRPVGEKPAGCFFLRKRFRDAQLTVPKSQFT